MGPHAVNDEKGGELMLHIEGVVKEQGYITGSRLTVFDFNVASLLSGIYDNKPATWLTELAREYPAVLEYARAARWNAE